MDLTQLLQVLQQSDQAAAASSPYKPLEDASSSIQQAVMQSSVGAKPGEAAIAGLLSGLLGGGASYLSNNYKAEQNAMAQDALMGAISGKTLQKPEGMNASVFAPINRVGSLFSKQRELDIADRGAEAKLVNQKIVLDALAKATTPQQTQRILQSAQLMGALPDNVSNFLASNPIQESQPIAEKPASLTDLGPDLGIPGMQEMEKQLFQENINTGMPPTQAGASARTAVNDMRARAKGLYGDKLAKEADQISKLEEIIRLGEEGMAKAGTTGSKLASLYEKGVSFAAPWATPEADRQVAGDEALNQTKQLGAMANRIVGSGPLSDFETKALFGTAMGSDKLKPENEVILRKYQIGLEAAKDHNSFMNYFMDRTGGNPQMAQQYWDLYKAENPVVIKDPNTGDAIINEARTPWQQFDFQGAYKDFMTGNKRTVAPSDMPAGNSVTPRTTAGSPPPGLSFEEFKAWKRGAR